MSGDDYLWDRSGAPDPEIERLERTLAPLRHGRMAPPSMTTVALPAARRRWTWGLVGAAAACACAAAVLVVARPGRVREPVTAAPAAAVPGGWEVTVTAQASDGPPSIDGKPVTTATRLAPGQVLETGARAKVRLAVPSIGAVDVEPRTRIGLVETGEGAHRIRLHVGTIHAVIWSPPGTFFVETPAGTAVDLGCAYKVAVDDAGDGLIRVHTGWVGFEQAGRESFIPAGAECVLRRSLGPGTPLLSDAPASFREALASFDDPTGFDERARALRRLLAAARPQEAVSLWHLLARTQMPERAQVLRRLTALVPAARSVERDRVLAAEPPALDQLWDRLGLGPISHWRTWKAHTPVPGR